MPDPAQGIFPVPHALMSHQQPVHDFLVRQPFGAAWLGVGDGKTLTVLDVLQTVRPIGHILVVAPVAIARSTWLDEIEKWGFPIRTKSLIVDENDNQLSKETRLARFKEPFSDRPTMYFVNQEMLTQPSQPTRLLVVTPQALLVGATASAANGAASSAPAGPTISAEALLLLDFLRARGPLTQDELIADYRSLAQAAGQKPPAKTRIHASIKELLGADLVARELSECRSCAGDGCPVCRFGLVDQMPIQDLAGPDGKVRKTIIWPFQTVIIDESQGFKSHGSNRFKALARVRPAMNRLVELTGTPTPNGIHDLWAQMYLLDQGAALGHNITAFRSRWFTPKMVKGTTTIAKWESNPGAEAEIHQAIAHLVISAKNTSSNRPSLSIVDVNVTLPPDLMQAYKDFKKDLVLDVVSAYTDENGQLVKSVASIVAENQATLVGKLMQFASGTLYTSDPDVPSTKGRYETIHDKKLEMAEYLVRNNGGDPVLIAYHYRSDLEQLLERFRKAGVDARQFDGSRDMVRRWNEKKIPVMLLHPASAGHGLNLQHGGSTMIWYTLPFSLEHYIQTNGRLFRTGQTQPVTIYQLITKDTHDQRLPVLLKAKAEEQERLIDAVSVDAEFELALLTALEDEIREDLNDLWISDRV